MSINDLAHPLWKNGWVQNLRHGPKLHGTGLDDEGTEGFNLTADYFVKVGAVWHLAGKITGTIKRSYVPAAGGRLRSKIEVRNTKLKITKNMEGLDLNEGKVLDLPSGWANGLKGFTHRDISKILPAPAHAEGLGGGGNRKRRKYSKRRKSSKRKRKSSKRKRKSSKRKRKSRRRR